MNTGEHNVPASKGTSFKILAEQFESSIDNLLKAWFPRCIDEENGGFLCDFDHRWRQSGRQDKMLEFQARTTRVLSVLALEPNWKSFRDVAEHGYRYLRDSVWDHEHGGWFRLLNRQGEPLDAGRKHVHGQGYAIAACNSFYKLSGDREALNLAEKGFDWIEISAHDDQHGGYFPYQQRNGERIMSADQGPNPESARDFMGIPYGLKDQNTTADLLDVLSGLYESLPSTKIATRVNELCQILCDRIIVYPGGMHSYFHPDWTPVPEMARYTMSVHASNLVAKAGKSSALKEKERMMERSKWLLDTALRHGWDPKSGGICLGGSLFGPHYVEDQRVFYDGKYWWTQAEGLRALLRLSQLYPQGDYLARFHKLWQYVNDNIIDSKYGGWKLKGRDVSKWRERHPKSSAWKDISHELDSLLECLQVLRALAMSADN